MRIAARMTPKKQSLAGVPKDRLPERVVIAQLGGASRAILTLPLLKLMKASSVRTAVVCHGRSARLFAMSGLADEIWEVSDTLSGRLSSIRRVFRESRGFRPEAFIDLQAESAFTALLARVSGAPTRVGFISADSGRDRLFTHLVSPSRERHLIENILWTAGVLGFSPPRQAEIPPPARFEDVARLGAHRPGRKAIVIAPGGTGAHDLRAWPLAHWKVLGHELLKDPQIDLILTGASEDSRLLARELEVAWSDARVLNLAGKTDERQLLQLISDADLAVSGAGAVAHLAAWAGTRSITIFGPDSAQFAGPRSEKARIVSASLACSPCGTGGSGFKASCADNQCMKRVSPGQVLLACRSMLFAQEQEKAQAHVKQAREAGVTASERESRIPAA